MEHSALNEKTRITHITSVLPPAHTFKSAFSLVFEEVAAHCSAARTGFVVACAAPGSKEKSVRRVDLDPSTPVEPIVVGRHERADVSIRSDPALSLRHALVILKLDKEAKPFVRVLDLRSGTGMKDESGQSHYSVAANGPVALEMAGSALFVLPASTDLDPSEDPEDAFDAVDWPLPVPWIPDRAPEARLREISEVTRSSSVVSVVQGRTGMGRPMVKRRGEKPLGMVRLEYEKIRHDHPVYATALRTGVLVGRYGRCDLSELSVRMPDVISRVHALFISMEERVHVFDVGSTNGLTFQSFPIRTLALPDHLPSTFEISEEVRLTWWPG